MIKEGNKTIKGALCWTCEKSIKGGIWSPFACDRHATHKYVFYQGAVKVVEIEKTHD